LQKKAMQLLLPIFPADTKMITPTLGFYEQEEYVYYLHNGVVIEMHHKAAMKKFRYVTSKFIVTGLCRQTDIIRSFGVSESSVSKNVKMYKEKGESGFFGKDARHGTCHKMLPDRVDRIQQMLDKGMSNSSIAKKEKISEGTIRYSLQQGYLKKNVFRVKDQPQATAQREVLLTPKQQWASAHHV
jgi:transposase